ncbi:hypothetical protein [Streptacidiphilus rugosus]|uniref:hypothetical protein n=1 Tax=Streptacidiphilus rugosus TaxID=405783 RepID=UPI0005613925|nr:hypothetical protein [Streptacidiphilus rugosus]
MTMELERVIGAARATQLVRDYQARLKAQDLLEDTAALRVAVQAFASGNVYVLAAPGQVWTSTTENTRPQEITIKEIDTSSNEGPVAIYLQASGAFRTITLNALDTLYRLEDWPSTQAAEPE